MNNDRKSYKSKGFPNKTQKLWQTFESQRNRFRINFYRENQYKINILKIPNPQ